jgi:hypothetical protein
MLKVAALKLLHSAISSVLFGTGFIIATQSLVGESGGEGEISNIFG